MHTRTSLASIVATLRQELPQLSTAYEVASLGVFGSYSRDEPQPGSDLDLLVTFREPPGLLRFIELEYHLSHLVGLKVDLVMRSSLKPRIGQRILNEAVSV